MNQYKYFFAIALLLSATVANGQPVTINALVGLKYDITTFTVNPGAEVTLTLNNVSDMAHNLLITKPGARESVVKAALDLGGKGPEMNFTPKMDEVLWAVPLISPGQTATIKFSAPKNEGVYPYVCTYPGHGFVMFGEMHVTNEVSEPATAAKKDTLIAPKSGPHPYALVPPYLYHVFIDGASPAAIAVHLPNKLSYCWDATTCSLRFAWSGDFLDMTDLWKGHFDASAKVLGEIFYRSNEEFPLRIGEPAKTPVVKYKGYRLINRYPEFHFTINGADVYELIHPKEDGFGLICAFRIPQPNNKISFKLKTQDNSVKYEYSAGKFEDGTLTLSVEEAKQFSVTLTSYNLAFKRKDQ